MRAISRRKGKHYHILVSYSFSSHKGNGFGSTTQFSTDRKIISKSELQEMREIIIKENGFSNLTILSYQFMS